MVWDCFARDTGGPPPFTFDKADINSMEYIQTLKHGLLQFLGVDNAGAHPIIGKLNMDEMLTQSRVQLISAANALSHLTWADPDNNHPSCGSEDVILPGPDVTSWSYN